MPDLDKRDDTDGIESVSPHILPDTDTHSKLPVALGDTAATSGDFADVQGRDGGDDTTGNRTPLEEPWRRELRRWLVTLNPGRTQYEYEKAVRYFFTTPGVPQTPSELTFDLLLAYRGALALRATAHPEFRSQRAAPIGSRLEDTRREALGGDGEADGGISGSWAYDDRQRSQTGPLSPATVNLRLTALRQFLVHCALSGSLAQLSPDRIRAALKRLSIERRRPYQVLAEPEWAAFLEAARMPLSAAPHPPRVPDTGLSADPAGSDSAERGGRRHGPWGVPRRARQSGQAEPFGHETSKLTSTGSPVPQMAAAKEHLPHSKAGLTGERTAQRDYALIALALATGLRAIELASLDVGDLSREWHAGREEWWLVLPDKKTKGQRGGRVLPLDGELIQTLQDYLEATGRRWERPRDRATPLFLSGPQSPASRPRKKTSDGASGQGQRSWGARLSPTSIRRIVDRVEAQWLALREGQSDEMEEDGVVGETRHISPHALRHSTAVALLEGNEAAGRPPASVEHVRGWLGHFDIRTTQGYLAHLESRKHRRPFTLSPGNAHRSGEMRETRKGAPENDKSQNP